VSVVSVSIVPRFLFATVPFATAPFISSLFPLVQFPLLQWFPRMHHKPTCAELIDLVDFSQALASVSSDIFFGALELCMHLLLQDGKDHPTAKVQFNFI
jgi:hypothetical protein